MLDWLNEDDQPKDTPAAGKNMLSFLEDDGPEYTIDELSQQFRTPEPVVEPPEESFGDTFARLAKDTPSLLKGSIDQVGVGWGQLLDFVGLDSAGNWMKEHYGQRAEDARAALDPTTRAIQEKPIYQNGEFDFSHIGEKAFTGAAGSSAQLVETLAPTTLALKGLQALKAAPKVASVLMKMGLGAKHAEFLGTWLTRGAAAGGAEGMSAGLSNSAQTEASIRKAPIEQLQQLDAYREAYAALEGQGLDEVTRQEMARDSLANSAALRVFLQTAVSTGGIGMVTGGGVTGILGEKMAGKVLAREAAKDARTGAVGFLKNVGQGGLEEAAQEAPQSAAETYIQNLAEKKYLDQTIDPTAGVVNAAIEGGLAGGLLGAVGGGAGHFIGGAPETTAPPAAPTATPAPTPAKTPLQQAAEQAPKTTAELKAKLQTDVADLTAQIDAKEERLQQEVQRQAEVQAVERQIKTLEQSQYPEGSPIRTKQQEALTGLKARLAGLTGADATPAEATTPTTEPVVASAIDEAAHIAATSTLNEAPIPTENQQRAENHQMGHVKVAGLDVSITHPQGAVRGWENPATGERGENTLTAHYGYIRGVQDSADGKLDVFVKPGTEETFDGPVFVVNQRKADGTFDEPKVVMGAQSAEDAAAIYDSNYDSAWQGRGSVVTMSQEQFKTWATTADMTVEAPGGVVVPRAAEPLAPAVPSAAGVSFDTIPADLTIELAGEPVNAKTKLREIADLRTICQQLLTCVQGA